MERKPAPNRMNRLGSVLRGEHDRALGRRAIRAGHLTGQELEDFLIRKGTGLGDGPKTIEEVLRAKGASEDAIVALRGELDRDDYALFRPDRSTPPEVLGVPDDPERRLAEFVLVSRLGQGGVGEVWKAWDTRLGRWVAVKLPHAVPDQEDASRRFTREALAAARLSHPNIVGIYRVAEERGRPFIVMQYLEGRTLGDARLDLRNALDVMRTVARAVHHAHDQGVVHRDLKPGNILIDPNGRPFVLDFGLAHLEEAKWLQSREGQVVGTAAYMSPEQAQGGPAARGRSTDVYSLGATLYEAVTGRPPFRGESFAEILEKVLHRDPAAPRAINPEISRDVEAVVLKTLEKDARNRYANALELAEDLERCLRDERPLAVRRGSFSATMRRRVRQHPRVAIGAAAVLIVLALVVGWLESQRLIDVRRDQLEKLRAVRYDSEVSFRAILKLRQVGANEGMEELLQPLEKAYQEARAVAPGHAEIDYLMGRIQRALMNDERAMELQERALAKDPDYIPALYEKVILAGLRFGREAGSHARGGLKEDCDRLRALLEEGGTGVVSGARADAAEGICLFHRGEVEVARGFLEKSLEKDPDLAEAREALAQTWLARISRYSAPADRESAYARAEAVLTSGIEQDRGYAPLWIGRAEVRAERGRLFRETGRDPQREFQAAEDDLTQALRLVETADAYRRRAMLCRIMGVHRMHLGGNPLEDFKEADADLSMAVLLDRGDVRTVAAHGYVACSRAAYRLMLGESPEEQAEAVEAGARLVLERAPARADVHGHRGVVWGYHAIFSARGGDDPEADFDRAEGGFAEALRHAPGDPEILERRAYVRLERVRWAVEAGRDAERVLAEAEADATAALGENRFFNGARVTRAAILRLRAAVAGKAGKDPASLFDRAHEDLKQVLSVNPLSTEAWIEQGRVEYDRGRYRLGRSRKAEARESFTQSIRSYEEALRLNPFIPGRLRIPLRQAQQRRLDTYSK